MIGATDWNGTTWFDRTNYFETVPTSALETALFLESDRMGHLLGAVTEEKLDNQTGVVQNEKRQGDNEPYGLVEYAQLETLFPEGHPYRHSTIGSMADLDASPSTTVQQLVPRHITARTMRCWSSPATSTSPTARPHGRALFRRHSARPANAGRRRRADPAGARRPGDERPRRDHPALSRPGWCPASDRIRQCPAPARRRVLGGLSSSRLDNMLVRGEQTRGQRQRQRPDLPADQLLRGHRRCAARGRCRAGRPAARRDHRRLYRERADRRRGARGSATQALAARIRGLEQVGGDSGKAVALAEGMLYMNDPGFYRRELAAHGRGDPGAGPAAPSSAG